MPFHVTDGENWAKEAYDHIAKMASNCLIYTQIVSYADDGIPLVHCYIAVGHKVIFTKKKYNRTSVIYLSTLIWKTLHLLCQFYFITLES